MSRAIPEIERDVLVTYFTGHWNRTQLATFDDAPDIADPGHGHDELSPVTFFGQPFDASKAEDLEALSTFAVQELSGYPWWELDMQDGTWSGQQLPLTTEDAVTWTLAAPGGDVEVVPTADLEDGATVLFTHSGGTFTAIVTAAWIHGAGFVVLNIAEIGAGGPGGRGHFDLGRHGTKERRVRFSVIIACPPRSAPELAEQYAGAAAAILTGVDFVRDSDAPAGTLEKDMADAGFFALRQLSTDPAPGRANHIGDAKGWRWYQLPIVFRRQYRQSRVGRRPIIPT